MNMGELDLCSGMDEVAIPLSILAPYHLQQVKDLTLGCGGQESWSFPLTATAVVSTGTEPHLGSKVELMLVIETWMRKRKVRRAGLCHLLVYDVVAWVRERCPTLWPLTTFHRQESWPCSSPTPAVHWRAMRVLHLGIIVELAPDVGIVGEQAMRA